MRRFALAACFAVLAVGAPSAAPAPEPEKKEAAESGEGDLKIWEWVNFAILVGGLGYLVRKYAGPFYAARAAGIRKDIEDSERARNEAEARAAEIDRRLATLDTQIAALREEAQKESAAEVERYKQQAAAEIAKIQAGGEQEIAAAQKFARLELQRYAAHLAVELAEQKVRVRVDAGAEERLVGGFVSNLPSAAN